MIALLPVLDTVAGMVDMVVAHRLVAVTAAPLLVADIGLLPADMVIVEGGGMVIVVEDMVIVVVEDMEIVVVEGVVMKRYHFWFGI